jgi:hypothetical protein
MKMDSLTRKSVTSTPNMGLSYTHNIEIMRATWMDETPKFTPKPRKSWKISRIVIHSYYYMPWEYPRIFSEICSTI